MSDDMDDEQLLRLVAASLGDDRPPADAVEAAYAAFAWRTLDADLAQLIEEAQPEVVGFLQPPVEPPGDPEVAFQTEHGEIRLQFDPGRVVVSATPPPVRVVLHRPDRHAELPVDPAGRAVATGVSGPSRFEVRWPGGSAVTPWLIL